MTFTIDLIIISLISISFGLWQNDPYAGVFIFILLYFIGILVDIHKQ